MNTYRSQAFVYYRPREVRTETIDVSCGPTDLVVKIIASARCGTDRSIFVKGHHKVDPNAPVVLGHELTGEVVEAGASVGGLTRGIGYREGDTLSAEYLDFQPGTRVTLQSRIARYANGLMLLADPITILSFYIDGGYSQYMRVPKELIQSGSVLRIPASISDEEAALVEPAACALESIFATPHAVGVDCEGRHVYRAGVKEGGRVCIIGSGTVSMVYARLCEVEGAGEIVMLVRSEAKADLARRILGGTVRPVCVPSYGHLPIAQKEEAEDSVVESLKEITGGDLFDDVVAACSDPDAQRLMLKLYNASGYAVGACFGGAREKVDQAEVDTNHYRCAKTIGTSGCSTRTMERIIQLLEEGRLSLSGFTSPRRFTFDDTPEDFFTWAEDGLKPVLYPWG